MLTWIVERHAEEAAHLWRLRSTAVVRGSGHSAAQLADIDRRLEGHLDGLSLSGLAGWHVAAVQSARRGRPGDTFVMTSVALGLGDVALLEAALSRAVEAIHAHAIGDAVSWALPTAAEQAVKLLLASPHAALHAMGLVCGAQRGWLHASTLDRALHEDEVVVRQTALEVAGLAQMHSACDAVLALAADSELASAAARAATLLGAARGRSQLHDRCLADPTWANLSLFMQAVSNDHARDFVEVALSVGMDRRALAYAIGVLGDPACMTTLLEILADPHAARVAGDAFSRITGRGVSAEKLEADTADDDAPGSTDHHLPWPDVQRAEAWWNQHRGDYRSGQRYVRGAPRSDAALVDVMAVGTQTHRLDAALGLALASGGPWLDLTTPRATGRARFRSPTWHLSGAERG